MSDKGPEALSNGAETKGTWTLSYGIHRGTIGSRDVGTEKGFASMEACEEKLREHEKFYRRFGYVIWFANAIGPDGTQHQLRAGDTNY